MVKVDFYETVSDRKKGETLGVFTVRIEPQKVLPVSEELKGKLDANGKDLYEAATERRNKKIEKAIYDCKCAAIEKVRSIIGDIGVLVASMETPEVTEVPEKTLAK